MNYRLKSIFCQDVREQIGISHITFDKSRHIANDLMKVVQYLLIAIAKVVKNNRRVPGGSERDACVTSDETHATGY